MTPLLSFALFVGVGILAFVAALFVQGFILAEHKHRRAELALHIVAWGAIAWGVVSMHVSSHLMCFLLVFEASKHVLDYGDALEAKRFPAQAASLMAAFLMAGIGAEYIVAVERRDMDRPFAPIASRGEAPTLGRGLPNAS